MTKKAQRGGPGKRNSYLIRVIICMAVVTFCMEGTKKAAALQEYNTTRKEVLIRSTSNILHGIFEKISRYNRSLPSLKNLIENGNIKWGDPRTSDTLLSEIVEDDIFSIGFYLISDSYDQKRQWQVFERYGVALGYYMYIPKKEKKRAMRMLERIIKELKNFEEMGSGIEASLSVSTDICRKGDAIEYEMSLRNKGDRSVVINKLIFDKRSAWIGMSVDDYFKQWSVPEGIDRISKVNLRPGELVKITFDRVMNISGDIEVSGYYGGFYHEPIAEDYILTTNTVKITVSDMEEEYPKYSKRYDGIDIELVVSEKNQIAEKGIIAELEIHNKTSAHKDINYFYSKDGDLPVFGFLEVKGEDAVILYKAGQKEAYKTIKIDVDEPVSVKKQVLEPGGKITMKVDLGRYVSGLEAGEYEISIIFGNGGIVTNKVAISIKEGEEQGTNNRVEGSRGKGRRVKDTILRQGFVGQARTQEYMKKRH